MQVSGPHKAKNKPGAVATELLILVNTLSPHRAENSKATFNLCPLDICPFHTVPFHLFPLEPSICILGTISLSSLPDSYTKTTINPCFLHLGPFHLAQYHLFRQRIFNPSMYDLGMFHM